MDVTTIIEGIIAKNNGKMIRKSKLIDGKWIPYDCINEFQDRYYNRNSWVIYAGGEAMPNMTWEEFFDAYSDVKKV